MAKKTAGDVPRFLMTFFYESIPNDPRKQESLLIVLFCPKLKGDLALQLEKELQMIYGEIYSSRAWLIPVILKAEAKGRVLWGLGPRSRENPLTVQQWQAFCKKNLDLVPHFETNRLHTPVTEKEVSDFVKALSEMGRLECVGRLPGEPIGKRARKITDDKPLKKKKKGSRRLVESASSDTDE